MASSSPSDQSGVNSWLEDEMLQQYRHDRTSVDPGWKSLFDTNGVPANGVSKTRGNGAGPPPAAPAPVARSAATAAELAQGEAQILRGVSGKIAENMAASV